MQFKDVLSWCLLRTQIPFLVQCVVHGKGDEEQMNTTNDELMLLMVCAHV